MDLFKQYLQYQKEVSQATLKVIVHFQQQVPHQPQSSPKVLEAIPTSCVALLGSPVKRKRQSL
jgi:hypothetical protein